ncbi:unnamed protein product [Bursaphelenchus xylophilus]|uniref:(pine wood nematode) hypothetical protein n=1 Tax=Bursaphelenchus xylophilus TaxID=6326 RepID=A0A1I7S4A5_BURXY|nr:unnamed protein product [Bursaphelenchus xylophilus]CAG9116890.1 unnamed protein product [Bursaphelenchus xylophilus]
MADLESVVQGFLLVFKLLWRILYGIYCAIVPHSWQHQKDVEDQVVLITGSGSGLGREMAVLFAEKGARLILWDLNETLNNETKRLVDSVGKYKATCYTVNVADRKIVYEKADEVKEAFGGVDILINNAGIVTGKKFLDCPDELVDRTMAVNTHALFHTAKAFVPGMIKRNRGHVAVVASMAGKVGVAGMVDYCASKFGAVGFAEALRAELRARSNDLHVTLICPYYINTGMFDGVQTSSPLLLPIMEPSYVAKKIVGAILTNQVVLQMPRFCYISTIIKEVLPISAAEAIADFVGVNREMENFKGRQTPPEHTKVN